MVVGLLPGELCGNPEKMITLWTLKTVLEERNISAVLMRNSQEMKKVPEFLAERFTICNEMLGENEASCVRDQVLGYLVLDRNDAEYYTVSMDGAENSKPYLYLEHPLLLLKQIRYHAIADIPKLRKDRKLLLVDFSEWNEERETWVLRYCRRHEIKRVVLTQRTEYLPELRGVRIVGRIPMDSPERYLGYIHRTTAVVTDFYMTTVLAALHQKEFLVLDSGDERESDRMKHFLEIMELTQHLVIPEDKIPKKCGIKEIVHFREILHDYRMEQMDILTKGLMLRKAGVMVDCPVNLALNQCMACGACEAVCPENAIYMSLDEKGFLRPHTDEEKCTNCGKCDEICPKRMQTQQIQHGMDDKPAVYVAKRKTMKNGLLSYSGLFSIFVHFIIAQRDGIVFGTVLNKNQEPVIVGTESERAAERFAQQRFVMTRKKDAFYRIREELEKGRAVLFAGLPCECAGLRSFLQYRPVRLIVIELMCHGVSSELLIQKYFRFIARRRGDKIIKVDFSRFPAETLEESKQLTVYFKNRQPFCKKHEESEFYQLLSEGVVADECCSHCPYGVRRRVGDITLGYLNEVHGEEIPEEWKDMSIMIPATESKGHGLIKILSKRMNIIPTTYEDVLRFQHRTAPTLSTERNVILETIEEDSINGILWRSGRK